MTTRISTEKLYADDEDMLIAASGDYAQLCPAGQTLAKGTDGAFGAAAGGSWILSSASTNFETRAVAAGHVLQLITPYDSFETPDFLIVSSVSGTTVTLRRPGLAAGVGQPPGPIAGLTNVEFRVATLQPQVETATYELNQLFVLDGSSGRTFENLTDSRQAQHACIALVLADIYLAQSRSSENKDDYAAKAKTWRARYDQSVGSARLKFNATRAGAQISPTRQSRLER